MAGKRASAAHSHKDHRERLRLRFEQDGLAGFHDYEVVEALLTLAHARGDTKDIGKEAIRSFGSVRGVLDASAKQLQEIAGIGPITAFSLKLVRAVAEYYLAERVQRETVVLANSRAVADYLRVSMGSLDRESFRVLFLNAQNQPVAVETLFEGTLTSSVVYPREVFKKAIEHGAAAIILAHNHPSGCVEPSIEDRRITSDLVLAAGYIGVRVLDHIVVGADLHFSFADQGLMNEYHKNAADFHESRRTA